MEASVGKEHWRLADPLAEFGSLRKEQGHNADAIALFERALAIKERTLTPGHPELEELQLALASLRA